MIINRDNNRARHRSSSISDINITPFVDVLLVLLIIFMVTAPIVTGGLNVDLPDGVAKNNNSHKDISVTISIKKDGDLYIGDEKIKIKSLSYHLHKETNKNFNTKIYVKADKANGYGGVMKVVKNINLAGFRQIILVTETR